MRTWKQFLAPLTPVVLALTVTSCAQQQQETASTETPPAPAEQTAVAPPVDDGQIAAIIVAVHDAEVAAGQQVQTKSRNAGVKAFSKRMATNHKSASDKVKEMATRLTITPQDNETSRAIRTEQEAAATAMANLSGNEFDRAYLDHVVAAHQKALDTIDQKLLPAAQNPELKQNLEGTRTELAKHLDEAKQLQTKLTEMAGQ